MKAKISRFIFLLLLIGITIYFVDCGDGRFTVTHIQPRNIKIASTDTIINIPNRNLNGVLFADPHRGFAVGDYGRFIKTTDGGHKWDTTLLTGSTVNLNGISMSNLDILITVGDMGTILRTTSGGPAWSTISVNTLQTLRAVGFYNANTGYAAGDSGVVLYTTNAGVSWEKIHGDASESYYGLSFNKYNTLFCVGNNGGMLRDSLIGVAHDTSVTTISAENLKSIHFALETNYFTHTDKGFAVGDNGTILKTINGGLNWSIDTSHTTKRLRSVFLTTVNWGYAVGDSGTTVRYNGSRWTLLTPQTTNDLHGVDNDNVSVVEVSVGENGIVQLNGPPSVPTAGNLLQLPTATSCSNWTFPLEIETLSDDDNGIIYGSFSANSNHALQIPPVGDVLRAGWAVNDRFHKQSDPLSGPGNHTFENFNLDPDITLMPDTYVYVTCCLKDQYGNPWLLGNYLCVTPH